MDILNNFFSLIVENFLKSLLLIKYSSYRFRDFRINYYANAIRPIEVDLLIGDSTKARAKLGLECKCHLPVLVKDMMQSDLKLMQQDQYLTDRGYTTLNYFE
jgi:hypothetical protein